MFGKYHKRHASPSLPEVKTGHLIDIFLSPPLSICHCCLSFQYKKGIRTESIVILSVHFPGLKKMGSAEKQVLGINYFNKTMCEEFLTHKRYFKENNSYYNRSRVASNKRGNPENLRSEAS